MAIDLAAFSVLAAITDPSSSRLSCFTHMEAHRQLQQGRLCHEPLMGTRQQEVIKEKEKGNFLPVYERRQLEQG